MAPENQVNRFMNFSFNSPTAYRIAFVCIVIMALAMRWANLDEMSFFADYDEYFTAKTVSGLYENKFESIDCVQTAQLQPQSVGSVLQDSMHDFGNNTLYNFVLSYYSRMVGFSDFNLRLFSVFFGVLTLLMVHLIGRELEASRPKILLAALLLTFNPILIFYSDVIRAYSWCVFLALLYYYLHLKVLQNRNHRVYTASIGAVGFAMFLSHYLMLYIIGISFLFIVFRFRREIKSWWKLLATHCITGVACLLFIVTNPQFIQSLSEKNDALEQQAEQTDAAQKTRNIKSMSPYSFAEGASNYLNQYYCYSYFPLGVAGKLMGKSAVVLFALLLLFVPVILIYHLLRHAPSVPIQLAVFIGLGGNLMVFVLAIASNHSTSFSIKYTIFSLPLYLIAIAFSDKQKRIVQLALAATCIMALTSAANAVVFNYQKTIYLSIGGIKTEIAPHQLNTVQSMITANSAQAASACYSVHSKNEAIFLSLLDKHWTNTRICIDSTQTDQTDCTMLEFNFLMPQ